MFKQILLKISYPLLIIIVSSGCTPLSRPLKSYQKFLIKQELIRQADSIENSDFNRAILLYNEASKYSWLTDFELYALSSNYVKAKKNRESIKTLYQLQNKNFCFCSTDTIIYCIKNDILTDTLLMNNYNEEQKRDLIILFNNKEKNCKKRINTKLVNEMSKMSADDQKYRVPILKMWGDNSKRATIDSLFRLQNELDELNFKRLKTMIAEHGWPNYSSNGRFIENLAAHIIDSTNYYIPLMIKAARAHELDWIYVYIAKNKKLMPIFTKSVELDDLYMEYKNGKLTILGKTQLDIVAHYFQSINSTRKKLCFTFNYISTKQQKKVIAFQAQIKEYLTTKSIDNTNILFESNNQGSSENKPSILVRINR
ncbi:MAG: hypothetical protein IT239_05975 [Bacteroidia bacterium]|nr:hypothetical protein [Bacteroidia bacterium]